MLSYEEYLRVDVRVRRAIRQAIDNDHSFLEKYTTKEDAAYVIAKTLQEGNTGYDMNDAIRHILERNPTVIYSKEFAQAFWLNVQDPPYEYVSAKFSRESSSTPFHYGITLTRWEYHQIQMIREDDPLEYLNKFIDP